MDNIQFDVRPCVTGIATSAVPRKNTIIDFDLIKKHYQVITDARLLLIILVEEEEIIVHHNGELKFKTLKDEKSIKRIAEEIYLKTAELNHNKNE